MLKHSYSGVQAYCHSKLAQIMMTFDLSGGAGDTGGAASVVARALHPSTHMPTKIVHSRSAPSPTAYEQRHGWTGPPTEQVDGR